MSIEGSLAVSEVSSIIVLGSKILKLVLTCGSDVTEYDCSAVDLSFCVI